MTTIAYTNGILACDSCWNYNSTQTTSKTKIRRLASGALYGSAGDGDDRAMIALLDQIKLPARLPMPAELAAIRTDVTAILVLPRGRVFMVLAEALDLIETNFKGAVWEANRGFAAVGSGADVALGAMRAGKTAKEAVHIACEFDINSRPPVHVLEL